jgi:hypothetical protein
MNRRQPHAKKGFTSLSILVVSVALGTSTRCTAAAQSPTQGLVAAWSFDETSGDRLQDAAASRPRPSDVFREYSWTTEKFHVFSLKTNLFALPAEADLKDATQAEVVVELANQHMGFEGMAIRLNGNQWYPIRFPASSPQSPSPSLWFHHWYPTVPIALTDLKEGKENTFEMKVPAECFDGKIHPNGNQPLVPWCPLYGLTVRVYYDPARKPHPTGKVLTPAPQSTVGLSVDLTASAKSENGAIRQIDFIGRYEDVNYEGDGVYDQWHGHLFHGKITNHLGSTTQPEGRVTWDTSWVPDQPGPMEIAARITDATGLIYMTEPVGGLKLVRPGLSVELCKPVDVPRSFTGCQYGEWVIPGVRSQKFTVKGDLSKILDARYVIASWGNQKECPGYTINGVLLQDKPAGADYYYNLSMPQIRPLTALKAGENTFSTVVAKGRMPDIYMPGVQVLIRYQTGNAGVPFAQPTATPQVGNPVGQPATSPGVLLPGDKPTRVDVGATNDYVTADGTVWLADRGFNNGRVVQRDAANVTGTRDPELFRTERNGMVDYTFAIPNGVYRVNLHLAETDPAIKTAGQRLFNVDINGWPIDAVDIFAETISNQVALVKSALVEVTNGVLAIRFIQRKGSAKLDALEIIPDPGNTPPPKPAPKAVSRRLPPQTPPLAKHFVLEDFENTTDADLHKKWNQWGQLSYRLDPDNKSRGQFGVTHQVGKVNTSWFGYTPRLPKFSCVGMNAWRMWVKPDGSGRLATFFIKDSSQEVYCWVIPDLLTGTDPYVLEVPLASYTYIFRENNAVFEPEECAEFGYWITGPCTFSLDDIMLVHNPDLPNPANPPSASPPAAPPAGLLHAALATNMVDIYDFAEVTLRPEPPVGGNPFTDAVVEGEFWPVKGGIAVKVDGFCDSQDGSVYRIRFMPSQPGDYRYKVTLRHAGQAQSHDGAFTARRAHRRGQLRVDSKYPEHFIWAGTGDHYFWNGATTYYLMGWEDDAVIRAAIDRLAALKVNRLRVLLYGRNNDRPWGQPIKSTPQFKLYLNPWLAARPDDVQNPGFDLTRFNVAFWQKYERMLRHARDRGVIISVIFFIGGQVLPRPFAAYSDDEQRYYCYAVARLAAFSNITWDLGNEHNFHREYPKWCDWMGPLVKEWDPYDHLLSAHNKIYRTPGKTWNDMQLIQRWDGGLNAFMLGERAKQAATGRVIAQINEEYGYEDLWEKTPGQRAADTRRRCAWEIAMAGCYQTTGETANRGVGFPPDTGGGWVSGRGDDSMTMLRGYANMVDFFTSFDWWRAEPRNDLVQAPAMCLADTGRVYAVYLPQPRRVKVTLDGALSYRARSFNPRTGEWTKLADAAGPLWESPEPPGEGDWALLLTSYDWTTRECADRGQGPGLKTVD